MKLQPTLALLAILLVACGSQSQPIADYQQARDVFWQSIYPNGGTTLYCGESFAGDYRKGVNVEHVFPMSWVTSALKCGTRKQCRVNSELFNKIEADLHNLYPARSDVNHERSSFPFAEIAGEKRQFGRACDFEVDAGRRVAEPTPAVRGEVARAMFYMADRYRAHGLTLFRKQGEMLLAWHNADPPGETERQRNTLIESLQGNRNEFIDDPLELDRRVARGDYF